jgi:hypothetical protein
MRTSDPVGGREAKIEAVARALQVIAGDQLFPWADHREEAEAAIAALDALSSSGSAAQNQEGAKQRGGARTKVCCPGCGRTLGDVMESLVRQRGRFKAQRNAARAELERLKAARSPQDEDHEPASNDR